MEHRVHAATLGQWSWEPPLASGSPAPGRLPLFGKLLPQELLPPGSMSAPSRTPCPPWELGRGGQGCSRWWAVGGEKGPRVGSTWQGPGQREGRAGRSWSPHEDLRLLSVAGGLLNRDCETDRAAGDVAGQGLGGGHLPRTRTCTHTGRNSQEGCEGCPGRPAPQHSQVLRGADSSSGNGPTAAFRPPRRAAHPELGEPPGREGCSAAAFLQSTVRRRLLHLRSSRPPGLLSQSGKQTQRGGDGAQGGEAASWLSPKPTLLPGCVLASTQGGWSAQVTGDTVTP